MIHRVLSWENLERAVEHLKTKPEMTGADGMRVSELDKYLEHNRDALVKTILQKQYEPNLVQEVDIVNYKGKVRTISKLSALDRLLARAIHQVLYPTISRTFSSYSYAYQEQKGLLDAVKKAAEYIEAGDGFTVCVDIEAYFDNVSHHKMIEMLKPFVSDEIVLDLVRKFLACRVVRDFEFRLKTKGLVQGSPLSPLLSNLYLCGADRMLTEKGYRFCRFADDVRVFCKTYEEGLVILGVIKEYLENELALKLNLTKSGVYPSKERTFLGYRFFSFQSGKVEIRKDNRKQKRDYWKWQTSAIQKTDQNYHFIADGVLTQRDYTLLFENPEKKIYLPSESIDSISAYSTITFSSNFFWIASQKSILINIFDKYGEYVGAFVPRALLASSSLTFQQAQAYATREKRLALASEFALAAAHNIRENLRYYAKHSDSEKLKAAIEEISELIRKEKNCPDIQDLMLMEARVRNVYYNCLNDILPDEDFLFTKRTKQPPKDALNALISFGNTILYRRIAQEIYKSRLDIRIGFLHASNKRFESLNLDISEIFRPVVVERVIFSLINKQVLHEKLHFEPQENGGVYLNKTGKRIFLNEFEYKMNQRIVIKGNSVSYIDLIREEVRKLVRFFEKGEPYKPFKYFL
jgi:group II intron reverse transcriptase/maturase